MVICVDIRFVLRIYLLPVFESQTHALAHPRTILSRSSDETQCCFTFTGNSDTYSIKIQSVFTPRSLLFGSPTTASSSKRKSFAKLSAMLSVPQLIIAAIHASNPQDVYAVEGFILLQMLACSCIVGVRAKSSYSKEIISSGSLLRRSTTRSST